MHHYGALSFSELVDSAGFILGTITRYNMLYNTLFSTLLLTIAMANGDNISTICLMNQVAPLL